MIAVVDYGMGNLHSISKAIEYVGEDVVVTDREEDLRAAERIVLPGVGAFGECMQNLRSSGLVGVLEEEVLERRKPFLGICVGMQLLARAGLEHGRHEGLGWIDAEVRPLELAEPGLRLPHTGWNEIEVADGPRSPLSEVRPGESFYFNHSFHMVPDDPAVTAAHGHHGQPFVAAIARDNIVATQFHPEKSQQAGIEFLAEFTIWEPEGA
jgi:glutamine amidotransferase